MKILLGDTIIAFTIFKTKTTGTNSRHRHIFDLRCARVGLVPSFTKTGDEKQPRLTELSIR